MWVEMHIIAASFFTRMVVELRTSCRTPSWSGEAMKSCRSRSVAKPSIWAPPTGIDAVKSPVKEQSVQPYSLATVHEVGNGENEQVIGHRLLAARAQALVATVDHLALFADSGDQHLIAVPVAVIELFRNSARLGSDDGVPVILEKLLQFILTCWVKGADFDHADQTLEFVHRANLETVALVAKCPVLQKGVDSFDHTFQLSHMATEILHEVGHDDFLEQFPGPFIHHFLLLHEISALLLNNGGKGLLTKVVELITALLVVKTEGTAELGIVEPNFDLFLLLDNGLPMKGDLLFNGVNVFKLLPFLGLKDKIGCIRTARAFPVTGTRRS